MPATPVAGLAVFKASDRDQRTIQDPEYDIGLFTRYLIEGFAGRAEEAPIGQRRQTHRYDRAALGEVPEAAAEAEPGATIYLRVPATLKHRVDTAASDAGMSSNAWVMRCIEGCLAKSND